jgi:hypothetical protein
MSLSNLSVPNNDALYCGSLSCAQGVTSSWNGTSNEYSGTVTYTSTTPLTLLTLPLQTVLDHEVFLIAIQFCAIGLAGPNNGSSANQVVYYRVSVTDAFISGPTPYGNSFNFNGWTPGQVGINVTTSSTAIIFQFQDTVAGNTDRLTWKISPMTALNNP